MMYNPCEQCSHEYPECKSCYYGKLQVLYILASMDLKKHAQCETCAHKDCADRGRVFENCTRWRYKEEVE
jgi:hypothetical protein